MASGLPNQTEIDDRTPARVRGIGARGLLAAAVAVPFVGLLLASWPSVDRARDVSADATALEEAAENVQTLTSLDGALLSEMSVTMVRSLVDELGIPAELTASVFGADPEQSVAAAIEATDAVIDAGNLGSVEDRLVMIRAQQGDLSDIQTSYGAVRSDVRDALQAWIADLGALPAVSSPRLADDIEVLTLGISMRSAIADAYYAFFSVLFDIRDEPAVEFARLIRARAGIEESIDLLRMAQPAEPATDDHVDAMLDDPAIAMFTAAVDDLIDDGTQNGVDRRGVPLTLTSALTTGADFDSVIVSADRSAVVTLEGIDSQAGAVVATATSIREDADRQRAQTYAFAGALALASFLAAAFAGRYIAAPLRRLEEEVDQLHAGEGADDEGSMRGPREVQAATAALRRASHHFSLATEQARRLASGELDAEVLDQRAEGGLGDSLQAAVDRLRDALAHQNEFRRRLTHEASHDGLTQIPNRNASLAQLTRALARAKRSDDIHLAVLFIDLDNFKNINDHHGHHAGDTVLTQVAQRLVTGAREGDFVGRLGGDEFIVIADRIDDVADAATLAERLLTEIRGPIALLDGEVHVRASIGIALAEADHLTAEELLRDADLAVYRAKAEGRGGIEICDEDLRHQFVQDTDLAIALQRAVAEDEFELHFQPIVTAEDHQPDAIEALVRWRRPDNDDLVPPGLFIEFAERSHLIVDIDRWVVDAVARQLAAWQLDPRVAGIPVSVNISGRHLTHPQLVEHVLEPLERHGVDPTLLIVEVTESALVNDLATASLSLGRLRGAGVRVAIDDFGTGYTSLAHLRALPVDILKIDRSFTAGAINDAGEASIVKLIIDAGHLLGATVTAEGIETEAEARRLVELGTDTLQGFYFAKPRPADQLFEVDLVATVGPGTD